MPDNRSKRPLPAVMDVGTFRERFGTDQGCWEHLRDTRWGRTWSGSSARAAAMPEAGGWRTDGSWNVASVTARRA